MKIGIVSAIDQEIKELKEKLENIKPVTSPYTAFTSEYNGHELIVIVSGLGKVNAAAGTQFLIDNHNPELIINLGICGGLNSDLKVADTVITNKFIQYDFNIGFSHKAEAWHPTYDSHLLITEAPDQVKLTPNMICGTGDKFIQDIEEKKYLTEKLSISICDMEAGAIAQICKRNSVMFFTIRSVSDIGEGTPKDFKKNMNRAIKSSTGELLKYLS